jgi:hypothetical protein
MSGLADIVADLQVKIGAVPIQFTRKALATNVSPPVIQMLLSAERWVPPHGPGASANARAIATREVDLDVIVWGATIAQVELLVAALHTALRQTMAGKNFRTGQGTWNDTALTEDGYSMHIPLTLLSALVEQKLPLTVALVTAAGGDQTYPTVVPTQVGFFQTGTTTDGILEAGEG